VASVKTKKIARYLVQVCLKCQQHSEHFKFSFG